MQGALLTKTDYDSLNLAIRHLHDLLGNIRLASITVGPTEADHETPVSRVDTLLKTVIARNTNAIGEVMADAINRNREGQQ